MSGTLYLVSTPIGNLGDITLRALETLKSVSAIACEDTRHSAVLLNHYGIKKPLIALHKFNELERGSEVVRRVSEGEDIAYITDAGMPCISDPGQRLVELCIEAEVSYTVLPGANAALSALVLSGFDSGSFAFCGFIPEKQSERTEFFERLRYFKGTLLFYSAPHNLERDLQRLFDALGARRACAVKEITKLYERTAFLTLGEKFDGQPRGEYVIVVEGAPDQRQSLANELTVIQHLTLHLNSGMSKMDAIRLTAKERGIPKSAVYSAALEIDGKKD